MKTGLIFVSETAVGGEKLRLFSFQRPQLTMKTGFIFVLKTPVDNNGDCDHL